MINFNGNIESQEHIFSSNRAFKYGDAVFETIKVVNGVILFWEDHYFRLMASMRIVRMEIPMGFTMEFLEKEIINLINANNLMSSAVRVRMTVFRDAAGLYTPETNETGYFIEVSSLSSVPYLFNDDTYVVDLFKDHYVAPQLLSTLKTTNRVLNVIAGIFAKENDLNSCLLLNSNKMIIEAINGNIFLVKGKVVKTPPLSDGCIKGIMRQQIITAIGKIDGYEIVEGSISPFELQKADELFVTNVIQGIIPITKYRKKNFDKSFSKMLIVELNKVVAGLQLLAR
jgi:branched-chain amino acid aminotransferase